VVFHNCAFNHRSKEPAFAANSGIVNDGVRPDLATLADDCRAAQPREWIKHSVLADFHAFFNIYKGGVDHGHTLEHPSFIDPAADYSFRLGQMNAGIYSQCLFLIFETNRVYLAAFLYGDGHQVGQVILPFRRKLDLL